MKKTIPFMLSIIAIASIASITVLGNTQSAYAGGEFLPIETTSLLLAAASSPAVWLTSLTVTALGIGAYVFTRNPSNIRNIKVILRDYLDRL